MWFGGFPLSYLKCLAGMILNGVRDVYDDFCVCLIWRKTFCRNSFSSRGASHCTVNNVCIV